MTQHAVVTIYTHVPYTAEVRTSEPRLTTLMQGLHVLNGGRIKSDRRRRRVRKCFTTVDIFCYSCNSTCVRYFYVENVFFARCCTFSNSLRSASILSWLPWEQNFS